MTQPLKTSAAALQRRYEHLARLMEVSQSIVAQLDLEPLLQQIVDSASQLLRSRFGGLFVFNEDHSAIQSFKVSGWPYALDSLPTAEGLLGFSFHRGATLRVDDVAQHPLASGFPADHPSIGPFLSAPLMARSAALGALFVGNLPGEACFDEEDETLLVSFAAQATIAIENARLVAKAEELARLQERQRISQALHDTVAQMLFSIGLEAEAGLAAAGLDEQLRARLQAVRRLAARSSDELRSAIFALRSQRLAKGDGLVQLVQAQVDEFQALTGIPAMLVVMPCFPPLPSLASEAVYRIVSEAFSNIRKHARASGVMVSLACDDDSVTVIIQDNGVGLADPLALERDEGSLHFGVATMRQITAQADGAFFIANNDDQGVMVKARFPLPFTEKK